MKVDIDDLLKQMTLEEKVSMVGGADEWHTVAIERLGIPSIGLTDGPNGAKGGYLRHEMTCACFPAGISMGASWDVDLIEEIGMALAEETISKGHDILLGPCVNIIRSPLGGRNFETFSEDPHLTGRIAVAYIKGLQSKNVGASLKHFACNNSEFERMTISSEVSERALWEIYLPAFKAAVEETQPWTVMCSYNRINGIYASENRRFLTDILKEEWGLEGFVVSDWHAVHSTVPVANSGLDLEMPGPPKFLGEALVDAVKKGKVTEENIDDKIRRILRIIEKAGAFERPKKPLGKPLQKPDHQRLIRRAAAESMVLLKNESNVLPLEREKIESVAVIGPNADTPHIQGAGSSLTNPDYVITPLEGVIEKCDDAITVTFEQGCRLDKTLPVINPRYLIPADKNKSDGLTVEFFNSVDLSGESVFIKHMQDIDNTFYPGFQAEVNVHFSAKFTGKFRAPKTGKFLFSLVGMGMSRLYFDDKLLIDSWDMKSQEAGLAGIESEELVEEIEMTEGQEYDIRLEFSTGDSSIGSLSLGCELPTDGDPIENAVATASRVDAAIMIVGTSHRHEAEHFDRPDMELPGKQVELIKRVSAANKNTIVVLVTGAPMAMAEWIDLVPCALQAWFPGQESGNSIADVLFGEVNPCGKLPETFPRRYEDNPAFINYPGECGKVYYGEGIFVGYRYYDIKKVEPMFPFGHGLSYTKFTYDNLVISASEIDPEIGVDISIDVKNTGDRQGKEVVQLYVQDVESSLARPNKELKGFKKICLEPNEKKTVTFSLNKADLSFYDPSPRRWIAEPGEFKALIGSSSRDIRAEASFELISGDGGDGFNMDSRLNVGSLLKEIMDDKEGYDVLAKYFGEMINSPELELALGMSLLEIAKFVPDQLTNEALGKINTELGKIE